MKPGDCAKVLGLRNDTRLNNRFVEIVTGAVEQEALEWDGVRRKALRHGVRVIGSDATFYVKVDNLVPSEYSVSAIERGMRHSEK